MSLWYTFQIYHQNICSYLGPIDAYVLLEVFYYIALKYGNFLLETLDTFPLLKDAYTQSRKLYENRISSWYGALQQIFNNIPF
jgi:hypothetical protein